MCIVEIDEKKRIECFFNWTLSSKNFYIQNYSFVHGEFTRENSKSFVTILLTDLENYTFLIICLLQIVYLQQQSQDCSRSSILRRLQQTRENCLIVRMIQDSLRVIYLEFLINLF